MGASRSPRPRGRGVRAAALAAAVTALMAGMTAGLWPPGAGDASAVAAAGSAGSWGRAVEVPGLAALNTGGGAQVLSVSCGSAGDCAAGGYYFDHSGGQGFVAVERNGRWGTAVEVPGLGALNAGGVAEVVSVSCGSAGSCAAGGYYTDGHGDPRGFVADERHGAWGTAVEVPGLTALSRGGAFVFSVSCASAGNCAAGGKYQGGHLQGFVADERHGAWGRAVEVPGLAALHKRGGDATVFSVSCASAGNCAAGGSYHLRHHHQGFVAVERNGRWGKAVEVPGLGALNTGGQAGVDSVSCASAGNCAAGGDYLHRGGQQGFVAVERNGRWGKAIGVPGLAALNTGGYADVNSVSCGSAGNCAAGGDYLRRGHDHGFVADEKNGRWGKAGPEHGRRGIVYSVSCASAGNCAAGGLYEVRHGYQGFVADERHGVWGTGIEVPGLAALNTGGLALVAWVSCPPAGGCAAGGYYTDPHFRRQGFVVSQTG